MPPPSHFLKIHLNVVLLSRHLGLPSGLFPSGFPIKTLYAPLLSPKRATCPTHLSLLDLITQMISGEEYRSIKLLIKYFSPLPSYLISLRPKYSPQHPISNTLSLHSSLNISDQVSCPYKTTGKIIIPYILIFMFLDGKLEVKRFCTK